MCQPRPYACIVPPHILVRLLESKDRSVRDAAMNTLLTSTQIRSQRSIIALLPTAAAGGNGKRRTIFDAKNVESEPPKGTRVRGEGDKPVKDSAVNEAYDGLGSTYDFYKTVFNRNSLDGSGLRLDAVVHYGADFNNAFWDGREMVFGDGDQQVFTGFTRSIDVIAHELTHGVTEFTAALEYHKQSGALNESISDVFGSLVKQWTLNQTADEADWLIGADVFTPNLPGDALRSLKAPGQAYDNELFGKDPQPASMEDYQNLPDTRAGDNGGVHINSGIPNKAFYLAATAIGGPAWDAPGHIWYETLTKNCGPQTQFQDFADATHGVAGRIYGASSAQQVAVREAWREVGIQVAGGSIRPAVVASRPTLRYSDTDSAESIAALHRRVDELAKLVETMAKKLKAA